MDSTPYRLKIKLGQHEFEAEGEAHIVQQQFEAFKALVTAAPQTPPPPPPPDIAFAGSSPETPPPRKDAPPDVDKNISKIMRLDGRIISLTVKTRSTDDAILILLYGQKVLRDNDAVTGAEIMDGIKATGGFGLKRVDRNLEKLGEASDVIVMGENRKKRYRLTNTGLAKARQIASDLIATVA
jgi:hypothetical protein